MREFVIQNVLALPPGELQTSQALSQVEAQPLPTNIGPLASYYLTICASKDKGNQPDKIFVLKSVGRKFYIGTEIADFDGDDLIIGGEKFVGTSGLLELLVKNEPRDELITKEDKINYEQSLVYANAIINPQNPDRPLSNEGKNGENILNQSGEEHYKKKQGKKQNWNRKKKTALTEITI